jgi:hypothetical protein
VNIIQAQMPPNMPGKAQQVLPLRDIKLPAEPGFWPLAPGWWLLIVALLLLLLWLGIKWYRYRMKKRRWLDINQQLAELEFSYQRDKNPQQLLTDVSVFLRRFVRFQLKQDQATSLVGSNWISYLNQFDPSKPFSAYETALTAGVYQSNCEYDAQGLIQTTRAFIRKQVMKPAVFKAHELSVIDEEQHRV